MLDILIIFIITVIAISFGKKILSIFIKDNNLPFLSKSYISYGIGIGFTGLIVLSIGLTGMLYKWVVISILLIISIICVKQIREFICELASWISDLRSIKFTLSERLMMLALCIVWFFTLIGSMAPILGIDALSYHMRDPKLFIQAHKIIHIPYTRDSVWPFLVQMLFTLGLLLRSVILAKLFHFVFGLFSIAGVYILCRIYWFRRKAITAAVIFGLVPLIYTITTYAYTDLGVVFYTIFAFYTFFLWIESRKNIFFYLSAIGCGFLLGIKITSAIVPVIIVLLYIPAIAKKKKAIIAKIKPVAIFTLFIAAISGIWYIRSWIMFGNPIFPFASGIFGGYGYPEEQLRYHITSGIGTGIGRYITMLWHLTLYPEKFGGESIGAIFLIFLPMFILIRRTNRFFKYTAFIALSLYTSWFIVYQYVRFLCPTLVFFSIIVTYIYYEISKQDIILRKISTGVLCLLFGYSCMLSIYHNIWKVPVVFGVESKQDFLLKHEPTYEIAKYMNKHLPDNSRIATIGEVRLFYFDRDIAVATSIDMDICYNRLMQYDGSLNDYLIKKGFKYVLYAKDNLVKTEQDTSLALNDIFSGYDKVLLKKTRFSYKDMDYEYQLWKIKGL